MLSVSELEQLEKAIDGAIQRARQPERLLTVKETAGRLGIGVTKFYDCLFTLKESGLEVVNSSRRCVRIREASLNKVIKKAAERGVDIFQDVKPRARKKVS